MIVIEDDRGRRGIVLEKPSYAIGRDPKCDLRLASQFVSRHHATLVRVTHPDGLEGYRIMDGDAQGKPSANGLLINGRKLHTHDLQDKDVVVFGPQVRLTYQLFKRDPTPTEPPDEFDITLISPNMVVDPDEETEKKPVQGHPYNLIGRRRGFANFRRSGSLRLKL